MRCWPDSSSVGRPFEVQRPTWPGSTRMIMMLAWRMMFSESANLRTLVPTVDVR